MGKFKGISYAIVSSSTFGLAPFFTLLLLGVGYSSFEVLTYRWGIASLALMTFGVFQGTRFHIKWEELRVVFLLSLFRAATSLSLVIAYQNIASGVASTIHFMYPLAVALAMIAFYHEQKSMWILSAVLISVAGAVFLLSENIDDPSGNTLLGIVCACISIFSYGGYIVGVQKSRAVNIDSIALTCYVMAFGALLFIIGGLFTGGIRLETGFKPWLYILGLALPATAISNMALVKAIKTIGPTLTSICGAMEPLTAIVIGVLFFQETITLTGAFGILLIIAAVMIVIMKGNRR